jgi:hypothetical protein
MTIRLQGIDCDDFTRQYLVTALWAERVMLPVPEEALVDGCMDVDENHPLHGIWEEDALDSHFDLSDFTEEAIRMAVADCAKFQGDNADDLCDEDDGHAGHDFWLTRNGHGAGFWDGDWEAEKGSRLSAASEAYGRLHIWVDEAGSLHFE